MKYYSIIKRNGLLIHVIIDEFQNNHAQWKLDKSISVCIFMVLFPNLEMPTCLLCVCLSGSVYCEEVDIDAVPPLPKESAYLYARFNKIKKLTARDFADIRKLILNNSF